MALLLSVTSGCSNRATLEQIALSQAETYLDVGNYTGAINYIKKQLIIFKGSLPLQSLLANAYMGRAGIELLPLVAQLMGPQDTIPLNIYQEPNCSPAPVSDLSELEANCFIYRVFKNIPPVDNADVLAAQTIYRTYFPEPSKVSSQVNFAAGLVEAISLLSRLHLLLDQNLVEQMITGVTIDPTQFPYDPAIHNVKRGLDELTWALSRFQYSYSTWESLVTSLKGTTLLQVGTRTLSLDGTPLYPRLLRFAALVIQDESVSLDQQVSQMATAWLNQAGANSISLIRATTQSANLDSYSTEVNQELQPFQLQISLANSLSDALNKLATAADQNVNVSFLELLWKNPPFLISQFLMAAQQSWDTESGAPLQNYYLQSGPRWMELKQIVTQWNQLLGQDVTSMLSDPSSALGDPSSLASQIIAQILPQLTASQITPQAIPQVTVTSPNSAQAVAPLNPALLMPPSPADSNLDSLTAWGANLGNFLGNQITAIAATSTPDLTVSQTNAQSGSNSIQPAIAGVPDPSSLVPPVIAQALSLLTQTNAWMTANFYPVSDWATIQ